MIKIKINNFEFLVKSDISVLEACSYIGINIPRFCYHEILSVAGNCRMCPVEVEKTPKPIASCVFPVLNNMQIYVDTPLVKKARENILEILLLNHPLDCPICDQAGECDLQDQAKVFGGDFSRFFLKKRGVEDKNCGPLIKTIMTRCISCTRCVRFGVDITGAEYLGTLNRGGSTEIGGYISSLFNSELSGNVIDLCPVGALTSKPYAFKARPWEIRINETIDLTDSTGSNIYVNFKESEIIRILPKNNLDINESVISDKARFSYDSAKNQRIQSIFEKSELKSFQNINWQQLLNRIDTLLKSKKKIIIIVDEELDLEGLNALKFFANLYSTQIKLRIINNQNLDNDFVGDFFSNKISEIKEVSMFCFLLSSNLRVESAILNTKLRVKFFNQTFKVVSGGYNFKSTFPTEFINLNLSKIINTFEGKRLDVSKMFLTTKSPMIFIGESLIKRFSKLNTLLSFFKKFMPSTKIFCIKGLCNSSGIDFLNIKALCKKDIQKDEILFAINLSDNISSRRLLFKSKKKFLFDSYGSQLAEMCDYIIPTANSFETEGTYINLENRPQKSLQILSQINQTRSVNNIFNTIGVAFEKSSFLDYINEIVDNSKIFYSIKNLLITNVTLQRVTNQSQVSFYPTKSSFEDFYLKSRNCKNSLTMLKCSQEKRKNTNNF